MTDAEKDAEIERLKAALQAIDDHGRALSFVETLNAQKAEIERLKEIIDSEKRAFRMLFEERKMDLQTIRIQKQLIRELAQELGAYHRNYNLVSPKIDQLLKDAWEATK